MFIPKIILTFAVRKKRALWQEYVNLQEKSGLQEIMFLIQEKRLYIPEEDKWIKLKISTSVLRTINKKGVSAVLKEARKQGFKI